MTFRLENHSFGEGRRALTATKAQTSVKKTPRLLRTKWIRLTRSISLDGRDGEKGSIQLVDHACGRPRRVGFRRSSESAFFIFFTDLVFHHQKN